MTTPIDIAALRTRLAEWHVGRSGYDRLTVAAVNALHALLDRLEAAEARALRAEEALREARAQALEEAAAWFRVNVGRLDAGGSEEAASDMLRALALPAQPAAQGNAPQEVTVPTVVAPGFHRHDTAQFCGQCADTGVPCFCGRLVCSGAWPAGMRVGITPGLEHGRARCGPASDNPAFRQPGAKEKP